MKQINPASNPMMNLLTHPLIPNLMAAPTLLPIKQWKQQKRTYWQSKVLEKVWKKMA